MSEPTPDELVRAATALIPFVRRWHLSLNPEDLEELAYAALHHARSDARPEQIVAAVEQQIDQHQQQARRLTEALRTAVADADQRRATPRSTSWRPVARSLTTPRTLRAGSRPVQSVKIRTFFLLGTAVRCYGSEPVFRKERGNG